jgi:quinol monooxygenase YgiN
MNGNVYWMLELEIQPGREGDFHALMEEMVSATQNESGTLNYEWSTSADGKVCHIYERYVDSEAVMIHLGTFGERFADRFMELFKLTRFVVYGSPSSTLKDALADINPIYMQSVGGFGR